MRARIGSLAELKAAGHLTGKVGSLPVCVFWFDEKAYAVEDRCPHMGFPLHRGTVQSGLLTCHWHHARFDLSSGGTLDPFADDVRAHHVEVDGDEVYVTSAEHGDEEQRQRTRLRDGLEQGLTLVIAKALLGLFETLGPQEGAKAAFEIGIDFGVHNREEGWGTGLTVLTAMANVLPVLRASDRVLALVHGLAFVARDASGQPPRFALAPLDTGNSQDLLTQWFRQFVDTRNGSAAEKVLASSVALGSSAADLAQMIGSAVTDHAFIDGGHVIDFTNKAFEALELVGWDRALDVLPTLAQQISGSSRAEESGAWRYPDDLGALLSASQMTGVIGGPDTESPFTDGEIDALAWAILGEDPGEIVSHLDDAAEDGASPSDLARAVAYAAALRLTRFHTQNDHSDWDVVHHGFTAANAVHQLIARAPTAELVRGVYQCAMKIYLDRFLNVPAARLPDDPSSGVRDEGLEGLQACWDEEGMVDEAGGIVYRWLRSGGAETAVLTALGSALLAEDAEFHWYQTFEAAVRQAAAWPKGSQQTALILAGMARFLAAHTPTRRELSQVVRIATRLSRGEALYEEG